MFYDDDVFYNENFYIMMNRFKEHYLDFSRFTTGQCIGVFTFKKDNYSFKFDSMLGLSSNFSIRYNDYSNDYEVTLIPCFSNTSSDYYFVKNKSSFIRLDVYNEFHVELPTT